MRAVRVYTSRDIRFERLNLFCCLYNPISYITTPILDILNWHLHMPYVPMLYVYGYLRKKKNAMAFLELQGIVNCLTGVLKAKHRTRVRSNSNHWSISSLHDLFYYP